ncbi:MAG: porin [Bacteroidetes bacterium]|nr:porin [Bacteroidota bacterium]
MKIIKNSLTLLIFIVNIFSGMSQPSEKEEFLSFGKPLLTLYSDFYAGISPGNSQSAFEVKRAYFGYEYYLSPEFTLTAKLDIGSPDDVSEYSLLRRYAYFKNACITYTKGKIKSSFGIIDLLQFKYQEKYWDHRYVFKSFQDEYRFGSSADLGWNIVYEISDWILADMTIMNGEGYTQLQNDYTYKGGWGTTLKPLKGLSLRIYYDLAAKDVKQSTMSLFLGYEYKTRFRIACEYNYKWNENYMKEYDRYGYSVYGLWNILPRLQIFGRYDMVKSNMLAGDDYPWNLARDGSTLIGGVQYSPLPKVRFALNYQDWYPYAKNAENEAYIYLNLECSL